MKQTVYSFCFFLFLLFSHLLFSHEGGLDPKAAPFVPAAERMLERLLSPTNERIRQKSRNTKKKVFCALLVSEEERMSWKSNPFICKAKKKNGEAEVSFYALVPLSMIRTLLIQEEASWIGKPITGGFLLGRKFSKKSVVWSAHLPDIVKHTILAIPKSFDKNSYVLCCGYKGIKQDDLQVGITGRKEKVGESLRDAAFREVFEETSLDLSDCQKVLEKKGSHSQRGFVYRISSNSEM